MKRITTLTFLLLFSKVIFAQTNYEYCDYDRYSTEKLTDDNSTYRQYNSCLDSICDALNKHDLQKALKFMEQAVALQPERVFISEEYEGLKYVIETKKNEATITQTTPEVEKEPESVEKEVSQNIPEPVKSNVISNEKTDNDISLKNKKTPKDNKKNKNKEKEVSIKSSESETTLNSNPSNSDNDGQNKDSVSTENTHTEKSYDNPTTTEEKPVSIVEAPSENNISENEKKETQSLNNSSSTIKNENTISETTTEQTSIEKEVQPTTNNSTDNTNSTESNVIKETTTTIIPNSDTKTFNEQELDNFKNKGLLKIKQLENYIQQISNNKTDAFTVNQLIESTLNLFQDPDTRFVEVSTKNSEIKKRKKIINYLKSLNALQYDDVRIEWAEINYTSDFYLAPDTTYRATVVLSQIFEGYKDGRPIYKDITTKRAEIILKKYEKTINGNSEENWDVFLGDISVEHTE